MTLLFLGSRFIFKLNYVKLNDFSRKNESNDIILLFSQPVSKPVVNNPNKSLDCSLEKHSIWLCVLILSNLILIFTLNKILILLSYIISLFF